MTAQEGFIEWWQTWLMIGAGVLGLAILLAVLATAVILVGSRRRSD